MCLESFISEKRDCSYGDTHTQYRVKHSSAQLLVILCSMLPLFFTPTTLHFTTSAAQRAKIAEKVHKPHYIEWSDFSDVGLNCESQGETCRKYKILIESQVSFDFSPLCAAWLWRTVDQIIRLCMACVHANIQPSMHVLGCPRL